MSQFAMNSRLRCSALSAKSLRYLKRSTQALSHFSSLKSNSAWNQLCFDLYAKSVDIGTRSGSLSNER